MAQHRASLRERVRTWWYKKPVHPLVLPIVWVVLSVLLLIGLALTIPPIINDLITPKEPEQTTQQSTPSPEQSVPPVLQVPTTQPSPKATQEPVPEQAPQPVAPAPQDIPRPVPAPVQPVAPQPVPQVPAPQLPPVLPVLPPQPVPSLPEVLQPVLPPILGPVVERPLKTVDEILGGTLDTVDKTVDGVTGIVGGLLR